MAAISTVKSRRGVLFSACAVIITLIVVIKHSEARPPPRDRILRFPGLGFRLSRDPTPRGREAVLNSRPRTTFARGNTRVVRYLSSRSYDYSYCSGGFSLKLRGKTLNKRNLKLTTFDAAALVTMLDGESLDDKMYIWCRVGNMGVNSARKHNRTMASVNVETANNFQGDMRLSIETVDSILEPFQSAFFETNSRQVPRFSKGRSSAPTTPAPETYLTYKPPYVGNPNKPLRGSSNTDLPVAWQTTPVPSRGPGEPRSRERTKRKVMPWKFFLWGEEVRFKIADSFSDEALSAITKALNLWEKQTCIKFIEVFEFHVRGAHLQFIKDEGCWSYIGKQSSGQPISVGEGCELPAIVAHEIGHALGFYHEQARPDRDNYVRIRFENIIDDVESNFEKASWNVIKTDDIPYDISSVMHYGPLDFSKNKLPTVEPIDPDMEHVIGQREILTFNDIKLANINYCSKVCGQRSLQWDKCKHGGYRNPKICSECLCPRGYAPPFCEDIVRSPADSNCTGQELIATETYQTFSSPGYPNPGLPEDASCTWRIRAPMDKRIVLEFVGDFEFDFGYKKITCDLSYVEVRKNTTLPGLRFCNKETPSAIVRSHGNEMLVLISGDEIGGEKGFQARFKTGTEQCGGCSTTALDEEPVCLRTDKKQCNAQVRRTSQIRENSCLEEVSYCCDGFQRSDKGCKRDSNGNGEIPDFTSVATSTSPTTTTTPPTTTNPSTTTTTTTTTPLPTTTTSTTPPPTTTTTTPLPKTTTTTPLPTSTTSTTPPPTTTKTTTAPPPTTTKTATPPPTTTTSTTPPPTTTKTSTRPPPTTTTTTTPPPTTTTTPLPTITTSTTPPPTTTKTTTPPPTTTKTATTPPTTTTSTTPPPTTTKTSTTPSPTTTTTTTPPPTTTTTPLLTITTSTTPPPTTTKTTTTPSPTTTKTTTPPPTTTTTTTPPTTTKTTTPPTTITTPPPTTTTTTTTPPTTTTTTTPPPTTTTTTTPPPTTTTTTTTPPTTTTTTTPPPTTTTTTTTPPPTTTTTTTTPPTTTTTPPPTTTKTTTPPPTTTTTTTPPPTTTTTTTTPPPTTTKTTTTPPTTTTTTPPTTTTTTTTPPPTTTTTTTPPPTTTTTTTIPPPTTTTRTTSPPTTTTTTLRPTTTATSTTLPPTTSATTTTPSENQEPQWGQWTSCTRTCGMCGRQFRFQQCSNPPCRHQTKQCPPNPCPPSSQPFAGCFFTFTGGLWCLPQASTCFHLAGTRALGRGGSNEGLKILGTVDIRTGKTTLNEGATLPPVTRRPRFRFKTTTASPTRDRRLNIRNRLNRNRNFHFVKRQ